MYTYIVVDDESLIRKGTIKKLEALQETVCCIGEASNGTEALALIENTNPDIIITDMNMPIMDGTQFLPLLTELYPQKRLIIISGYKDFEYTKHAISAKAVDYILKPFSKEEIQKTVLKAVKQIADNDELQNKIDLSESEKERARYEYDIQMLKNIVLGYHTATTSISSSRLKFVEKTHDLVLIAIRSSTPLAEETLQNFLSENGFGDLAIYLQHIHCDNLGFLILFMPEQAAISVNDLCKQVVNSLSSHLSTLNIDSFFGISNTHSELTSLNTAFGEAVDALNSREICSSQQYTFYSYVSNEPLSMNWDRYEEFLFRIESGMTEQVKLLLDDLFHYFESLRHCTLSDVKYYCFQLADSAKLIMSEYLEQVNTGSVSGSMQNILNTIFSLEEIKQYYAQFFANITDILKAKSVYASNDVIEKMQIYARRNYYKNLNVEFLSSLFYMSRSYCSHLFKEKTGENFVDFVNQIRIEKAKELLRNTDKKMYQISKSVGYDNVKYFFRIFKKIEGITPEQYRKGES
ncbi:response regulator [Konateibacter massiliensis]|uniref:response regulator n=1 Tax=Konateibacter massiliensis TaxID=2002841 RepID=UPI000C15657A|nr:response regulator [Konateibacter massiliensis]